MKEIIDVAMPMEVSSMETSIKISGEMSLADANMVFEKLIENDFEPGESKEDLDKIDHYSEESLNEMRIKNLEDVSPETADAMFNALFEGEKNDMLDIMEHGFADLKELVKSEMGWSDDIINSIENMDQYEVYKNASLNEKEIDGRPCLVKEINWDYVDPKTGFTNRELAAKGRTPIDVNTGEKIELHHMGQEYFAPFAELCENSEHGDGKHRILHPKMENSWRNDPELEKKYSNVDKPNHWRERSQEV